MIDCESFIKDTYPFNRLPEEDIKNICESIILKHFQKGEIIFRETDKPLEYLFVIVDGEVFLEKQGQLVSHLKRGDFFGYVSLLGDLPPATTAKVVEKDTVILLIPKNLFLKLIYKYEDFARFFTKELAKRVHIVPKTKSSIQIETLLNVRVKDLKLKPPISINAEETLTEAIKLMAEKDSTYCLVEKNGQLGILTERDIIKKVLAREIEPKSIKVKEIASFPTIQIDANEPLFNALLVMAKHGIRKLVIKEGDALIGVLDDRTVISHESKNIVFLIKEIDKARTIEELAYLYSIVQESIIEGVLSGIDPEYVGKYIAELNDRFMLRVAYLTEEDIGKAPVAYSILVIGSEGRREQSLKTDQDNALIYEQKDVSFIPVTDKIRDYCEQYFDNFGKLYIENLLKVGFPPCPGDVMLSNPYWRKSKEQWMKEINNWMETPKPENLLNISIFFDFRSVAGSLTIPEELWDFIMKRIKTTKKFLPFLASEAVKFKPPLGFFKSFIVEKTGPHKGKIDIKKYGIFPITQGIRVLSLENGIRNTNTFERIRKLKEIGVFTEEFAKDLEEGYRFLMSIRLKSQAMQIRENFSPDNYIDPHSLSKAEKNMLKEVFQRIEDLQKLLFDKYNLRYFS